MQVTGDNAHVKFSAPYNDVTGNQNNQYNTYQTFIPDVDLGPAERILRRLRPANMDASHRTGCLPGTRTTWTQFVMKWALNPNDKRNVLWIYGLAGSGKSTLATEVANQLHQKGRLGAFLFFERDVIDRSEPAVVIRTVTYQLGLNQAQLRDALCAIVESQPNAAHFPLESQFRQLLVNPIQKLAILRHHMVVIVLDAFDECGTPEKRQSLLRILAELTKEIPYLRFVVTSRPEPDIRSSFESQLHVLVRELDTSSADATQDISSYLTIRLNYIKSKSFHLAIQSSWPGDEAFHQLVHRASGLFIWATTAAQFIDAYDPVARLRVILRDDVQNGVNSRLDTLYRTALGLAGEWDDENFVQDFRSTMGVVLASARPLSAEAIDRLRNRADDRQACAHVVSHLGCLMQRTPFVRLLHPSFADFLFTGSRCERSSWFFNQTSLHHDLTVSCINHLNHALAYNVCNLTLSEEPANGRLSESFEYACIYWIEHICRVQDADFGDIVHPLEVLLFQHLLHWIEAMSILKMTRESIGLLQKLSTWFSKPGFIGKEVLQLVNDGVRFVRRHVDLIETHPLLVYSSALPFTPRESLLFKTFHDSALHPVSWGAVESSWSPLLQVLSGHESRVNSVGFSPDGTRIVSGSDDLTIRVWDASSGIEVLPPLRGHEDHIRSVAFSLNGDRIASGSRDHTVRLWDASSGDELLPPMKGHTDIVNLVTFSPDGKLIVSGSDDARICIWDVHSGAEMRPPLKGHTGRVLSISVSRDGTHIVSGSDDETVRVWDITSGVETLAPLQGHSDIVTSVSFSPDGNHIVSGSEDRTVRLWDANTGDQIHVPFQGHTGVVTSVAFSPDGKRIISCSGDKTIRVWDATTGIEAIPHFAYNNYLISNSFSPDGTRIASGSMNGKIQVWDATSSVGTFSKLKYHTRSVTSLAFCPDGNRLVSGSDDGVVQVWDTTSGAQPLPPLRRHDWYIWSVAFSPDGTRITSASSDETVRVWDATTGREVLPPLEHGHGVRSAVFSSDGSHIVSRDYRGRQYVWDAKLGHRIPDGGHVALMAALTGDIVLEHSEWITDQTTKKYLFKLPSTFLYRTHCSYKRLLAVGTNDGQVFMMRFPTNG